MLGLLKPNPYNEKAYAELLQVLYNVFQKARKDGLVGLEAHIEDPAASDIFKKYPFFSNNHHALPFLCDTLKVLLTGAVEDHHLAEILDLDLERQHEESRAIPAALAQGRRRAAGIRHRRGRARRRHHDGLDRRHGDGDRREGRRGARRNVPRHFAVVRYGQSDRRARSKARQRAEHDYMSCIRTALLAFARGDSPMTCVEFARRNIEPVERPTFAELEALTRRAA